MFSQSSGETSPVKEFRGVEIAFGALPAATCSRVIANSPGLNERPSRTSTRGVVTLYQGSTAQPAIRNSIFLASVTRREASRISIETRSPWPS